MLMLLNMIVFSVQASDGHTVHVRASCDAMQEPGACCTLALEVAARGCTLSAEELAGVFEPFSCADDAGSHVRAGCIRRAAHLPDSCCSRQAAGSAPGRLGLHVSRRLAEGA
jgi:hypothetical protein